MTPDDPKCVDVKEANPQSLYDWMEVNIGTADGRHRELIPDGKLCSANRQKYAAFDEPGTDWPATPLMPDDDGTYSMTWNSTAPHSTAYYQIFLTKNGFDPEQPLAWGDLDLVHDTGALPAAASNTFAVELPERNGRHMIYTIWQRNDSTEAFYSCSDVVLGQGASELSSPTPVATPTADPDDSYSPDSSSNPTADPDDSYSPDSSSNPTADPDDSYSPDSSSNPTADPVEGDVDVALNVTSDWGTGYCVNANVSTASGEAVDWGVGINAGGPTTAAWNTKITESNGIVQASGAEWNQT
ncbi:MAG: chitin-binding protein, partial [Actinomycetes bacterium]